MEAIYKPPIISCQMPPELVERIDQAAAAEGRSRSSFIRFWLANITELLASGATDPAAQVAMAEEAATP